MRASIVISRAKIVKDSIDYNADFSIVTELEMVKLLLLFFEIVEVVEDEAILRRVCCFVETA